MSKKKSWDYQRGRYKQINIKFDMNNDEDALMYRYLHTHTSSITLLIKLLLYEEMKAGGIYGKEI